MSMYAKTKVKLIIIVKYLQSMKFRYKIELSSLSASLALKLRHHIIENNSNGYKQ